MWDWWRIKGMHTPYEWALQVAAESIDPFGEERADIRAAVNTANLMAAQSSNVTNDQVQTMIDSLRSYLQVNQVED